MSKYYTIKIKKKLAKRRGFPVRIFIDKTMRGFEVSQFDGKYKKSLSTEIQSHAKAVQTAKEWEEYYRKIGRGAKIIDFSLD